MSNILNFRKNTSAVDSEAVKSQPIEGQMFTLDILNILPSRFNPRKTHGLNYQEHYDNLKTQYAISVCSPH